MDFGLCQPSLAILLISIAGVIYHTAAGDFNAVTWWTIAGLAGTGVFQALCFGGLEPVAWVLMSIPVLIVCFFLAVALFASRMRIENIMAVPCDRCGNKHRHQDPCAPAPSRCHRCNGVGCPFCQQQQHSNEAALIEQHHRIHSCPRCSGTGCMSCLRATDMIFNEVPNYDGRLNQGLERPTDDASE